MKIYFGHSSEADYQELYSLIKSSAINGLYEIILPKENEINSKEILRGCDLMVAEVSLPSTGMGIEIGWASMFGVPIICVYKQGSKVSHFLEKITPYSVEYSEPADFIIKLEQEIAKVFSRAQ